ncbi:alcohol dehydrogenase family protein [Sulfitobacter mediterraneus]|uniref:alcohol dehydrogenase family protein n=1 Tax=Sulfitobacter mediterraneus TaxID=83219 RepID=UPI0021A7D1D6|nr:alcohol dehydrogenase family protein [Sulfitobacter mediterraneus]UWR12342.1 alcohol dehydrogenase family protein [Sulfitobacter mediterraneus]
MSANEMLAVVTTGNGGYDRLKYGPVPIPEPGPGEVLLRVLAAGINNTEINTRLGWYSSSVKGDTASTATTQEAYAEHKADGGWNGATPFPLIQGTDCCGSVVQTTNPSDNVLLGKRVLVRACMRPQGYGVADNVWMASDFDGAFAQYVKVPSTEIFPVACDWSDAELATVPCAYGTSENMLHRAKVGPKDFVLVTGASGGVGSATIQLAKRRGATVAGVTSLGKSDQLRDLGVDIVVERGSDYASQLGEKSVDVVVDNVAGPGFPQLLKLMKPGGRYVSSGAIAGPVVELDMRDMYLKDITLIGCTGWDEPVFPNLISYIERGEIRPLLAKTFPLGDIALAQEEFLKKKHFGNFVLIPPVPQS